MNHYVTMYLPVNKLLSTTNLVLLPIDPTDGLILLALQGHGRAAEPHRGRSGRPGDGQRRSQRFFLGSQRAATKLQRLGVP